MTWTLIEPPGSSFNCLLNQNIIIRVQIPNNNRFTITGDGSKVVVNGDRHEIIANQLPGGKCPGEFYRIKGFATNGITGFNEQNCGELFSVVNGNGTFEGPITEFEQFERTFLNNDGSIQAIDYYIRVRDKGGARLSEGRSQWQFAFADMNPDCYEQFGIDPEQVEQGDRILFIVPISRSGGDTVNYQEWERVDGTSREQDEEDCASQSEFTVIVYDCNDEVIFNGVYEERPIVDKEFDVYDEPIIIKQELYRVMSVQFLFFIEDTPEGSIQCLQIELQAPLVIGPLPPGIPTDDQDLVTVPLQTYRSPPCEDRVPLVEIQCDCFDECPPNTHCVIQEGNQICCYDINGNVIQILDDACIDPDIIC